MSCDVSSEFRTMRNSKTENGEIETEVERNRRAGGASPRQNVKSGFLGFGYNKLSNLGIINLEKNISTVLYYMWKEFFLLPSKLT